VDLPAGDQGEKPAHAGDADLLLIDVHAEAFDPLEIVPGIEPVAGLFADRDDEALALVQTERGDGYAEDIGGFTNTEQCVHRRLSVGCCVDRTLEPGIWQNLYLRLTDIMPVSESLIYLSIGGYAVGFFAELGKEAVPVLGPP
jgi:hypothetical protein